MIYPQKISAKKTDKLIKIFLLVSIAIGLILIIINKLVTPNLHWAAIANAGIIYGWVTVIYSIKKKANIAGHVLIQAIAISVLTWYIDYVLGFKGWSLDLAIPIIIIIANITMLILTIVSYKKYLRYAFYQLIIFFFSMLPLYFLYENMMQNKVMCFVATGISILNFVLSLILCKKDVKDVIIRKFHM